MKKLLFVGLAAAFATGAFAQNLVNNPGFETGDLTGWTVNHAGGFSGVGTSPGSPHSGSYSLYLGATSSGDAEDISQSITTVTGAQYLVSFWAYDEYGANDPAAGLNVTFGGNSVFGGIPNPSTYAQYSGTFTATGTSTTLDVNGWETSAYINVDDISVTRVQTPEPASMAVLGLGALALIRRRRNRK